MLCVFFLIIYRETYFTNSEYLNSTIIMVCYSTFWG